MSLPPFGVNGFASMVETESQPLLESGETPSSRGFLSWLSDAARRLKREIVALYIASSDPRMPLVAKVSVCFSYEPCAPRLAPTRACGQLTSDSD
jgi:hypothetical protein